MRAVRRSVGLLGIAALAVGVGTVVVPGLAARLDVGTVVENDYLFVVPLGIAGALVVLGALASRTIRGVDQASPPDPERVPTADTPGAEFDRLVGGGLLAAPAALRRRETLHDRLREAALRTVMRAEQCSRADARRQIDAGSWTDDPVAAAFLAEGPDGGVVTAREAAETLLTAELPVQRRARRTAVVIDRAGRGDPA